jgi:subfamily B ATP-binding cassette protein MsbA
MAALVVAVSTAGLTWFLDPAVSLLFSSSGNRSTWLPLPIREQPMLWVPGIIMLMAAVRFIGQRCMARTINRLGNSVVSHIQMRLFSSIVRADLGRLQASHSGAQLSSILYDADLVRDTVSAGLVQYVQAALIGAGGITTMFIKDWLLTIVVIAVTPMVGIVMAHYLRETRKAASGALAATSSLSTAIIETLNGVRIVKIANREGREEAKISERIAERQSHLVAVADARSMVAPATEMVSSVVIAGLLVLAGWEARHGGLTSSGFLGFVAAFMTTAQAFRQMAGIQGLFSQGGAAAKRLFTALDVRDLVADNGQATALGGNIESVSFENVSLEYQPGRPVLKGVSFVVRAGQMVALVGPSGSGKSSILNLITRFFDPTGGRIRINDTELQDFTLGSLRSNIALVTQEPFLFDDTIHANIAYGAEDADAALIEAAARSAAAHDFIEKMPTGYQTGVGEGGRLLSGGQRQRVAIARAFVKNAPILILDEPTSALDAEAERYVQDAIERLMQGRTTFIVAHRLSTIQNADLILVMKDGQIVEMGRHQELLASNGVYRQMVHLGDDDLDAISPRNDTE